MSKDKLPRVLFHESIYGGSAKCPKDADVAENLELPANDLPDELKRDMTESEISRLWVVRLRVADKGGSPCRYCQSSLAAAKVVSFAGRMFVMMGILRFTYSLPARRLSTLW
jgi:hypothetical protein